MSEVITRYVDVLFDGTYKKLVEGVYQYDHGLKLRVHGVPTDVEWQMQWGYRGAADSVTTIASVVDDAVVGDIPDALLMQQREAICYLYYEDTNYGITVYEIYLPLMPRLKPATGTYTPEQIEAYDQLVAELQELISNVESLNPVEKTTIAPLYENLTFPVSAGQHCWYSDTLYKAKQDIISSETWTASHWDTAVISDDIGKIREDVVDLKSAINKDSQHYFAENNHAMTWESGYLRSDGTIGSDSHRCVSSRIYPDGNLLHLSIDDAFELEKIVEYSGTTAGTKTAVYTSINVSGEYVFKNVVPGRNYRLQVYKLDGTTLSPSDISDTDIRAYTYSPDKTLTASGKVADAKATGERANEISENACYPFKDVTWEQGSFIRASGAETTVATAIRTAGFLPESIYMLKCTDDYRFVLHAWDKSKQVYAGHLMQDGTFGTGDSYGAKRQYIFNRSNYKYRVVLYKNDSSQEITPASGSNVHAYVRLVQDIPDNVSDVFTPGANAAQGENSGVHLRVMNYNVAAYDHNTTTHLSNEQILNYRKMLYKYDPDFILLQEEAQYIDSGDTKSAKDYLYLPKYPYNSGDSCEWPNLGGVIRSKIQHTAAGYVFIAGKVRESAQNVKLRYATYTIGNKTLLMVSTHPLWSYEGYEYDSAECIALRLEQYGNIFDWVSGTITLKDGNNNDITVPEHTHCIIGMDANSALDVDKTNLATLAAENNFILGNGGYLGWLYSCALEKDTRCSLDNIIVSDNIIINNFEVLSSWTELLYSDHVPVYADVVLQ